MILAVQQFANYNVMHYTRTIHAEHHNAGKVLFDVTQARVTAT